MSESIGILFLQGVALGALAAILPGPDMLLVLRSGIRNGREVALRCTAGIGTGLVIYAALTLLLAASTLNWDLRPLKLAGAGYLIILGVQLVRAPSGQYPDLVSETLREDENSKSHKHTGFTLGFISAVTNPKLMLWFGSVVLQLVGDSPSLLSRFVIVSGMVVGPILSFICLSLLSACIRHWLTNRTVKWIDRITGGLLIALACVGLFRI